MKNEALIVLATYNEIENLPLVVEKIVSLVPDVDLLVVDDDSPDGTGVWATEEAQKNERLFCRIRPVKNGLGAAVLEGLNFAIERNYRFIINLDADFSHPIETIPVLLETIRTATNPTLDVVIGSRYVAGGGVEGWPLVRRIASRCVNVYSRWLLGLRANDVSGSFRCYRVETLKRLDFSKIRSRGYSFFEEFLFRLQRKNAAFAEVPIRFVDRVRGVSKINGKEALLALWIIFRLALTRPFDRSPSRPN